jgi:hypothetical protein
VYIYHGDKSGILFDPVQKIFAENIDPRLKGFGISLSSGVDVDGNHYNGTSMLITEEERKFEIILKDPDDGILLLVLLGLCVLFIVSCS